MRVACESKKDGFRDKERILSKRIKVHGAQRASTSTPCTHQHFLVLEVACGRLEFQEKLLEFGWIMKINITNQISHIGKKNPTKRRPRKTMGSNCSQPINSCLLLCDPHLPHAQWWHFFRVMVQGIENATYFHGIEANK
jgi:hypothetical protein